MSGGGPRLAFFSLLPEGNAATRVFCVEPSLHMKRLGFQTRYYPPSGEATYRSLGLREGRLRFLARSLYWYALVFPRRLAQLLAIPRSDIIFIQRGLLRSQSVPILEGVARALAGVTQARVVCHYDDGLYTAGPAWRHRLRFRLAHWVVTGNAEVAAYARRTNSKVWRWEAGVEVDRYPPRRATREQVVIGWAGTLAAEHLAEIAPVIAAVAAEEPIVLKVVSGSQYQPDVLGSLCVWQQWEYEDRYSLFGGFDIGVMPLTDTAYNRAKEAFKIKEYMASGLPVVASKVGHNREIVLDGETGFLVESTDEWVHRLLQLARDPGLRARLGDAGRRRVLEHYAIADRVAELGDFFRAISSGGSPARSGRN